MTPVETVQGDSPVILGLPHTGLDVPKDVWESFNETGRALADADWNIHKLYDGVLPGATTVRATFHRYVIDANRDPSDKSLYPGQNTTTLCPLIDFNDTPIYREGREPDEAEIKRRKRLFHAPYHTALAAEIKRVHSLHGLALLYDCHSIRSVVPFLFEGTLPDFNIGTDGGATCNAEVERIAREVCEAASGYSTTVNGRFRGGWTTRHYGRPDDGVHAIQMELAQKSHLAAEAPPFDLDPVKSERLRMLLADILTSLEQWALNHAGANNE
ncbi:N-formylglutamate deformylase [Hoeflea prorocentri]|uniref:N-formylglutamate deformylase n=1 Tax=Hoeflea prorocentri TaxID=1922333 RepID=A0A9X3ZI34_9HYPH|nr:N-formylglutamate deformylase [Hoeflea prorocentri]MCY6382004.1 N-formylglutamate deformylase [Hoeflea prorocentri]MDA5399804.1 N-formylglutamate deformylase [Hoeflea prorocentri]